MSPIVPRMMWPASPPIATPNPAEMKEMIRMLRYASTIAPNTAHPSPRTSSRLRPNASITPRRSTTIDGATTAQIVIRIRPGTISSTNPMPIAIAASKPFRISAPTYGAAASKSSSTEWCIRPSRVS